MDTLLQLTAIDHLDEVQSAAWWKKLVDAVNDLLVNDFNGLIQILYRLDVSEEKIRTALEQNKDASAAVMLAKIILERQIKKLNDRKKFSTPKPDGNDEMVW